MIARYALEPIGADGALEATGEVHYYCSKDHANRDVTLTLDGGQYTAPIPTTDAIAGTVCETCGKVPLEG